MRMGPSPQSFTAQRSVQSCFGLHFRITRVPSSLNITDRLGKCHERHYRPWRDLSRCYRILRSRSNQQVRVQLGDQAPAQKADEEELLLPIRIRTQHGVSFGEVIRIVGAGSALGDWNPDQAPGMHWAEGDEWAVDLQVPPGIYDFKCVVTRGDGSIAAWEPGENRTLKVPEPQDKARQVMEVVCPWSNTAATFMSFDEDDATARLESTPQGEAVQAGDLNSGSGINPAAIFHETEGQGLANLDAGSTKDEKSVEEKVDAVASAIQSSKSSPQESSRPKETKQPPSVASSQSSSSTKTADPAAEKINGSFTSQQTKNGIPEAPRKSTSSATKVSSNGKIDENLEISSSSTDRAQEGSPQDLKGVQKTSDVAAPKADKKASGTPLQGLAGLLGLIAVPVVFWSEYTLKQTGCGLPPGPSGYLGAAEGVSYLTVLGLALAGVLSKLTKGRGLPRGPGGLLGAAEGLSYTAVILGSAVLGFQYKEYGYIPSALPDSRCFGEEASSSSAEFSLPSFSLPFAFPQSQRTTRISLPRQQNAISLVAEAERNEGPSDGSVADTLGSTIKSVQRMFMSDPNSEMEYLSSGAEDGLSSAELEPVVEEFESMAAGIVDFFNSLRQRLSGSVSNNSNSTQQSSELPRSKPTSLLQTAISPYGQQQQWDVAQGTDEVLYEFTAAIRPVGMDLGVTIAANNAASAANNVTQNLQNEAAKLNSAATAVEESAKALTEAAAQQPGTKSVALQEASIDLEGSLERAEETLSLGSIVEPLVEQLQSATADFGQDLHGDEQQARIRETEEQLAQAVSIDTSAILAAKSARTTVDDSVYESSPEAVDASDKAAKAVIATLNRARSLIDNAVETLRLDPSTGISSP